MRARSAHWRSYCLTGYNSVAMLAGGFGFEDRGDHELKSHSTLASVGTRG
jgi:hypothetical protein